MDLQGWKCDLNTTRNGNTFRKEKLSKVAVQFQDDDDQDEDDIILCFRRCFPQYLLLRATNENVCDIIKYISSFLIYSAKATPFSFCLQMVIVSEADFLSDCCYFFFLRWIKFLFCMMNGSAWNYELKFNVHCNLKLMLVCDAFAC